MCNQEEFNLITYNVRLFNHFKWDNAKITYQDIVTNLRAESPDILCLQEFVVHPNEQYANARQVAANLKMPYV
ncbi:MAG: hypothetical protein HC896_13645, partial [Bacteroidales bacterium]|nr:hypothetical protein [Bacteroidales bacterium]